MLRCRQFCVFVAILSFLFLIPSISFSGEDRSKIPVPLINPAGDLSVYKEIYHEPDRSREIELPDGTGKVFPVKIRGEYWYMTLAAGESAAERKQTLAFYLKSVQAVVRIKSDDRLVFSVEKGDGAVWWGFAAFGNPMALTVIKENRLLAGKALTFKMGKDAKADAFFYIDIPGDTFNTLFVTVPEGRASLHANVVTGAGFYRRDRNHAWDWDAQRGPRLMIDTLPQDKGKCIFHLSRRYDAPLTEITIRLVENPIRVPPVKLGEAVGALRIKNVPYGWARIEPEYIKGSVSISHPEYPASSEMFKNGDLTPAGDIYLRMPAGLWKVAVKPRNQDLAAILHARHIPINSGEETVLQWPAAMTSVFGVAGDGGLKINAAA
ncbi:MAG: hypothetical protein GY697_28080, partial [Desulfobacterales bacterium]|nr:hypothetical protein [Desulfobacterales bacterium]